MRGDAAKARPNRRPDRPELTVPASILPGPAKHPTSSLRDARGDPREGCGVTDALDAATVRRWSRASVRELELHRDEIDRLNVFPIADNDTGTNMLFTFRAGDDGLQRASCTGAPEALSVLARASVLAARGNS